MPGLFDAIAPLFAQDAGAAVSSNWQLLMLLPVPFLFYFMIILPQKEQEKKRRALIDGLKKNDRVVTAGGVHGTVVSVDKEQNVVVLRTDDEKGVRTKFDRSSIVRVLESSAAG